MFQSDLVLVITSMKNPLRQNSMENFRTFFMSILRSIWISLTISLFKLTGVLTNKFYNLKLGLKQPLNASHLSAFNLLVLHVK